VKKKIFLLFFVFLLLLTVSACGSGSYGNNSNGTTDLGVRQSGINSIGGIGGDDAASKTASTPTQPADITVLPLRPSMAVDATMQFTAKAKDANGEKFQWSSSAPSVATIDSNGVATGMGAGTTQITATAGGKTSPSVVLTLCDYRHT
jgi:uncharacterized protein YjdB